MAKQLIECVDFPEGKDGVRVDIAFEYDLGDNLDDAVEKFGKDTVFQIFEPALRLRAQKTSKIISRKGDDVQAYMDTWKPSDSLQRGPKAPRDKVKDFMEVYATMDEARKQEIMAMMQADKESREASVRARR